MRRVRGRASPSPTHRRRYREWRSRPSRPCSPSASKRSCWYSTPLARYRKRTSAAERGSAEDVGVHQVPARVLVAQLHQRLALKDARDTGRSAAEGVAAQRRGAARRATAGGGEEAAVHLAPDHIAGEPHLRDAAGGHERRVGGVYVAEARHVAEAVVLNEDPVGALRVGVGFPKASRYRFAVRRPTSSCV